MKGGSGMAVLTNSARIWAVADQLPAVCARSVSLDIAFFSNICIQLSRRLDYAIAYNQVPDRVSELPAIFKLACQRRNVCSLQAAITVLMLSVKNACKAQWFASKESQELLTLANEVVSIFCTPEGFRSERANIIPSVLQIISRYYPRLKLDHVLASISIKPGFEACAVDFPISKNINFLAMGRIGVLVAKSDTIDTSSCIINPQEANILFNGVGLEGRVVGCMYQEPQLPTVVNSLLRYGTNLLQAIGHFDAHYVVLVAFMSAIQTSDLPVPSDYVQPPATAVDSDAEIIEGPQTISLDCPIKFSRIKNPVKGYLCKHLQCFDLSNYIEINSKRPSWRCPLCNQPVCYLDIRIDRNMFKILQEVDEGVMDVIIHSDGSWDPPTSGSDHFESLQPEQLEAPALLSSAGPSNYHSTDVHGELIGLDAVDAPEDRKPIYMNPSEASVAGDPSSLVNQNSADGEQWAFIGTNQCCSSLGSVHAPSANNLQLGQMMSGECGGNAMPGDFIYSHVAIQALEEQKLCVDSAQYHSISQSLLQQSSTAQMGGVGDPIQQVPGNAFGGAGGLEAPFQGQLGNNMRPQTQVQARGQAPQTAGGGQGQIQASMLCAGGMVQRVFRTEDLLDVQSEQNWQPSGRMRGSLLGRAYNEDRDGVMIRPTQTQPTDNTNLSPHLRALVSNLNLYSSIPD